MSREAVIQTIEKEKIMVITRGIYGSELVKLAEALYEGGIRCFEITYDPADPDTLHTIKTNIQHLNTVFKEELTLGVGTVMSYEHVANAYEAGAKFLVSPHLNPVLVKATKELGMVSIPGAMTPTEIVAADECGADFIKLFPAGTLGMKYCKDIYAPLHHVKYLATVGVTEESLEEYLNLGFKGAGISSQLVDKKLREANDFATLTERARRFVEIAKRY